MLFCLGQHSHETNARGGRSPLLVSRPSCPHAALPQLNTPPVEESSRVCEPPAARRMMCMLLTSLTTLGRWTWGRGRGRRGRGREGRGREVRCSLAHLPQVKYSGAMPLAWQHAPAHVRQHSVPKLRAGACMAPHLCAAGLQPCLPKLVVPKGSHCAIVYEGQGVQRAACHLHPRQQAPLLL